MSGTVATGFPLTGRICRFEYEDLAVEHDYRVPGKLSYKVVNGMPPVACTADITVTPIGDGIFAVIFTEEIGTSFLIENLTDATVDYFLVAPGQPQVHLRGAIVHELSPTSGS
jgi:hypothetical protein